MKTRNVFICLLLSVLAVFAAEQEKFSLTVGAVKVIDLPFALESYRLSSKDKVTVEEVNKQQLRVIGVNVGGEVRTHKGRIDLTVETATDAYIIEVKRDSTAKKAIEQIQAKEYTDRFRASGKPITLIGMSFSTKRRAVSGVKIVRNA